MAKFTKLPQKSALAEVFPEPIAAVPDAVDINKVRCGGCAFFLSKLDPNNPFDGACHALPPVPLSVGYKWARTASNEHGCSLFKNRGQ